MKHFLLLLILVVCSASVWSQTLSIKSFKLLEDVSYEGAGLPVRDQNGDICALVKVVTAETDFECDGGMSGIVKMERKNNGFWLFIPSGSKRITIKHDKLGVLRDYAYPEAITAGAIYEMVLTDEKVKTIVVNQEEKNTIVWLVVKTAPVGAELYINDVKRGVTPLTLKLTNGRYSYYLDKPKYNRLTGDFILTGEEPDGKKELTLNMLQAIAVLKIGTEPETGATVLLDGKEISQKTPVSIEAMKLGKYSVVVQKEMYLPASEEITITNNDTIQRTYQLKPNFGTVGVTAPEDAMIYIDSVLVGKGFYHNRIAPGIHTFQAKKEQVKFKTETLDIVSGDQKTVTLVVQTDQGTIEINSEPSKATVYINEKNFGKTPFRITKMQVGKYYIKLEKEGFEPVNMPIVVEENVSAPVSVTLKALPIAVADSALTVKTVPSVPNDSLKTIEKIQKQVGVKYKQVESWGKKMISKIK